MARTRDARQERRGAKDARRKTGCNHPILGMVRGQPKRLEGSDNDEAAVEDTAALGLERGRIRLGRGANDGGQHRHGGGARADHMRAHLGDSVVLRNR